MREASANRGFAASLDAGRTPAEIERDLAIDDLADLELLRAGRAASLFRAQQIATQRTVAVKVLHDELSSDTGQRFDRERAITGQLSGHTGIVPLFHTGSTADGEPYLVMPYYQRGSLADLMTRYGPLSWREATFILEPVAVTLSEVHGRDLVHRNLKPGNVLLTDFLLPRVADFGMCLPTGQSSTAATLVDDGPYGPPEVIERGPADPATDVYGLAAILAGLLCGKPPQRQARDRRSGSHGTTGRPVLEPSIEAVTPPVIVDLLGRSLAAEPSDRPANAASFVTELRHAVARAGTTPGTNPTAPDGLGPDPALGDLLTRGAIDSLTRAESDREAGGAPAGDPSDRERSGSEEAGSGAAGSEEAGMAAETAASPAPKTEKVAPPARERVGEREWSAMTSSEVYLLLLVGLITVGILAMVIAALVAVQ